MIWWYLFRRIKALYVVSIPFALYGLAFLILGMGLYAPNATATNWVFNVATGLYAAASASGSLYFALNFGTEGMLQLPAVDTDRPCMAADDDDLTIDH
jgi:alpha-1,3-glucan synthase